MRIYNLVLKACPPSPPETPEKLDRLGDHLRKTRLERELQQAQVADLLGVDKQTVCNWENHRNEPTIRECGGICRFLGYDPFPEAYTLSERMSKFRKLTGTTMKAAAGQAGVDPGSWAAWENGRRTPIRELEEKLRTFLAMPHGPQK